LFWVENLESVYYLALGTLLAWMRTELEARKERSKRGQESTYILLPLHIALPIIAHWRWHNLSTGGWLMKKACSAHSTLYGVLAQFRQGET